MEARKGRGGYRPGAGRKPADKKVVGVTVYLSPAAAERLKELRKEDKATNDKIRTFFDQLTR